MAQLASLSHKAAAQHGPVVHVRAAGDDEVIANHPMSYVDRRLLVAVDTSIVQPACPANAAIISHPYIFDRACIENHDVAANSSHGRGMLLGIVVGDGLDACHQFRPVAVQRHDVGQVGRQFVVDGHLATACLIQDRGLYPITKRRDAIHQQDVHILNESIFTNLIIGYVVLYVLYAAVIAHRHVV